MSGQTKTDPDTGDWTGWRSFVVRERIRESDAITSFVLAPTDGGPVRRHRPGQYLTVLVDVSGKGEVKRTYTVSSAPGGATYRVSIKRESDGTVSTWFHDSARVGTELRIGPPAGDFVLPDDQNRPIVLLSAGVGLTPMISMLEALVARASSVPTLYVHGTRDGATHAMRDGVRRLATNRPNISVATFYSAPRPEDQAGRDYDEAGRVTVAWLRDHAPADADYFICGAVPFLRDFVTGLAEAGIPHDRIHYEFFGPVEQLLATWPEALDIVPAQAAPPPLAEPRSERSIHISREEIGEAFLAGQADAVIVSDREGFITLWNPGAERIFGFSEHAALGQPLDIIVPEALRARHWDGYWETVTTGQSRYGAGDLLAVPALRHDGTRISIEFTITMLKDGDGQVTGMIAVLRDVSGKFEETRALRKRVAELEAKVGP